MKPVKKPLKRAKPRNKPHLVRVGDHYLDPANVCGIKMAKKGLYIVMLRSNPEPDYPIWITVNEWDEAKHFFDILGDIT